MQYLIPRLFHTPFLLEGAVVLCFVLAWFVHKRFGNKFTSVLLASDLFVILMTLLFTAIAPKDMVSWLNIFVRVLMYGMVLLNIQRIFERRSAGNWVLLTTASLPLVAILLSRFSNSGSYVLLMFFPLLFVPYIIISIIVPIARRRAIKLA